MDEHSQIRRAGVEDATDIARLLHDFNTEYDDPTPPIPVLAERIRELLATESIVVLLAGDEPAIGIALFRIRPSLWSSAEDVYLEELYVVPGQRGRGIGRALLTTAIEAARAAGANHFELTTGEEDIEARALYESCGLTNREGAPDGPRMLYYELDL
ncbi:MAG TPA: GNAT family N-acetyltransferase [Solirubrobacterales bacterium]|nr:GNAT family N-acetyltransferase [Solirubrobacterales bacterium]